jgi:tetratricopeptide (TPR) repeat protein
MNHSRKIVLLIFLLPMFVAAAAWVIYHETRIPQNEKEALNRMIELQQEGRYDKAAKVMQTWMGNNRRDVSHDGFLYGQIAIVWLQKAYARRGSRDESIGRAEENLQKQLRLYEGQKHDDLSLDLFEIGRGYEVMADISDREKCRLYGKARELFERQLPLIKGDSYTAYGHTTELEPVRHDVKNHLDGVSDKLSKASCQVNISQ